MYINSFDGLLPEPKLKNPDKWDGRQLISIIFPKGLNLNMGRGRDILAVQEPENGLSYFSY